MMRRARTLGVLATTVAMIGTASACSDDETKRIAGDGGSGGAGGSGGTGGTIEAGCSDLPVPGPLAEATWSESFTVAGVSGLDGFSPMVYDLAFDPQGNLVVAGYFSWIGDQPVDPLVRQTDAGWESLVADWGDAPHPEFSTVAFGPAGSLALATHKLTSPHRGVVLVDAGEGIRVVGRFSGQVRRMEWIDGELWVAGHFALEEGGHESLAIWDGASWRDVPGGAPDGPVYELRVEDGALLVGGAFSEIGGIPALRIAAWDGTEWTPHDFDLEGVIYALERGPGGELIAGGMLYVDPMEGRGGIAHQVDGGWEILGNGVAAGFLPGVVSDLQWFQGELYLSGCFSYAGGAVTSDEAVIVYGLAKWSGTEWSGFEDMESTVRSPWQMRWGCGDEGPDSAWRMEYQRLASDGERLYAGGAFSGVAGVATQSIASWDGVTWSPVGGDPGDAVAGIIHKMGVGGPSCSLFAFGSLTHGSGRSAPSGVLEWRDGWVPLGGPMPAEHECIGFAVDEAGQVHLGCTRWPADWSQPEGKIYRVGAGGWEPVGEPHDLGPVQGIAFDAAGRLWVVGGAATGYVARLGEDGFEQVGGDFDHFVRFIDFSPSDADGRQEVVVGGAFTRNEGDLMRYVARWDGESWSPLGGGLPADVSALAWGKDGIYAATTALPETPYTILGLWDGTTWRELATPENGIAPPHGQSTHTFVGLLARGDYLVATGYVWGEDGERNAFLWDGNRFEVIGGGIAASSVDTAAITHDSIWFGGSIAEVGPAGGEIPSVGAARLVWDRSR